jgi:hypothetical protein
MAHIAVDRLDKARYQLRPPPELHIDLTPGVVDLVPPLHKPVVDEHGAHEHRHNDRKNERGGHEQSFHPPEGTTVPTDQAKSDKGVNLIDLPAGHLTLVCR